MDLNLQINTKYKEEDTTDEPVSPSGQYFNSKTLSVRILGILESEIPIDDSNTFPLLEQLFLPINPRFSSIMVHDKKGVKHWKRVEVKLEEHVHVPKYPNGLSIEEYNDYFDKYLTEISIKPLPKDKPMWEIHFFKYPTIKSAGQVIFKFHHALGDGFSLMGALLSCMQRADNPSIPLTFPSIQPSSETKRMDDVGCVPKTMSAIYNTACDFGWSVVKSSMISDDKTPIRSGVQGVEFHPIQISTVELSLDHVKQVKNAIGATINDVITGIIFLGTRLYMQATGKEFSNSETTALVLLNTRNIDGYKSIKEMLKNDSNTKWGNQFAFLHVGLPSLVNDQSFNPLTFISQAQKTIKRKRNSLAVYLTGQSLEFLRKCRGPEASAEFIHSTLQNSTMTVSNMIGPVEKMSLANHPCKGLYFMVVGVPQSLTITIMSYMRTLRIAVGVEKGYIDAQKFNSSLENAFQLIYKAAMKNI
ncbi:wax ester synthase/diacylglycerol acyltransferase 4-like [Amaranthus tricolor]|uniref:wax ester synthase/diacylglycerol acyltransferase 4-like n=1 Tax=Amaranthus tricolor TaxID=29722 RepID=UPI00258432C7|nr:wax ester synthase/diacylglycerol acyltransferase 4-like [Amaranthus tricolor]